MAKALRALRCASAAVLLVLTGIGCASGRPTLPTGADDANDPPPNMRVRESDFDRDPRTVSATEALADLELAAYAFDDAYAGALDDAGRTSTSTLAAARAAIRARSEWPPADLAHLLRAVFGRPDGHLAFGYGGRAPLRLLTVAPRHGASESRFAHARAIELTDGDVPVLAIRTFDNADELAMRDLPELARRLRRAPQFVVDVRGNAGGNYSFAERFVLELTNRELQRLDEREVLSVAAAEGRANTVRRRLAAGGVPSGALPHFRAQLGALEQLASDLRAQRSPRADLVTVGRTVRGRAEVPLRARAVFLVDRGCASACEMLIALARQIPGVVVVGENTRGGMAFGELAIFRLPNSGILVSLGTRAFSDPLGDFVETRGYEPDVRVDGRSALEEAKQVALATWKPPRKRQERRYPALQRFSHLH